jgi:2-methylcitrate dehydratase
VIAALARRLLSEEPAADATASSNELLALVDALSSLFEAQHAGAPATCVGPVLPGATLVGGARVPGTSLELEPSQAAWCVGWLTAQPVWGALLPLCDYLARRAVLTGVRPARVATLLQASAQVRSFARSLVLPSPNESLATRVAIAGVAARLLGASDAELEAALALALADGVPLHSPGTPVASAALASSAIRAALQGRGGVPAMPGVLGMPAFEGLTLREPEIASPPGDAFATWHRFDDAVRRRFPEKAAARLLAAIHSDVPIETLAVQSFVAALVRAS